MKITIYELLRLIKDGKAPKKIKYKNYIYTWNDELEDYYRLCFDDSELYFYDDFKITSILNDIVEIIEEDKKIENCQYSEIPPFLDLQSAIKVCNSNFNKHQKAIYELIDEVNKLKEVK